MTSGFDPLASARAVREQRLYPPVAADLPTFGAHGLWRAGTQALRTVIEGWWVGEAERVQPILADAARWLDAPEAQGLPWGEPALFHEAEHRHARALAAWMTGQDDAARWREAAATFARLAKEDEASDDDGDDSRAAEMLCLAMAGETPAPASGGHGLAAELGAALHEAAMLGEFLVRRLAGLVGDAPELLVTTLCAYAFGHVGQCPSPPDAIALAQPLLPKLVLAPAYRERGWRDAEEASAEAGRLKLAQVEQLAPLFALTRDRDAVPQGEVPALATWTRHPGLDLELDWQSEGGRTWIEARGAMAGRLIGALAGLGDGRIADGPDPHFAEQLSVPPGARHAGNAALRWRTLAALLRAGDADRTIARALVAAGLVDPDWRVRMLAVYGTGALELADLAERAQSAALPPADYAGLNGDDRHTLLALRDAAAGSANGIGLPSATHDGAGPGGARRIAFVGRIAALIGAPEQLAAPGDRHEALLAALLDLPEADDSRWPRAWQSWRKP